MYRSPVRLVWTVATAKCWYINMGAVDKAFFTTEVLVKMSETGQM
jgi:hypothetical protein